MFQSIRRRLILSYILLTLFTVATVGLLGAGLIQRYAAQQERDFLEANADAIARQAAHLMSLTGHEAGLARLTQSAAFLGDIEVRIFDTTNRLVAASTGGAEATELTWIADTISGGSALDSESILIFGISPQSERPDYPAAAADFRRQMRRGESLAELDVLPAAGILTIRRSPSFWGHRLSFESSMDPDSMMEHHESMQEYMDGMMGGQRLTPIVPPAASFTATPAPRLSSFRKRLAARLPFGFSQNAIAPIRTEETEYGYVAVSRAANVQAEPMAALRRVFLLAAAGAIGLATVIGMGVSRGLTAPIQSLAQAAGRMAAGDLASRAPVHSRDELGALAGQFNRMADQLQSSFDALQQERDTLRRFVADASHELRTPMTALRTFHEILQGQAGTDDRTRAEFLAESEAQLARLEWITRNLLDLSRLDAGVATLEMTRREIGELMEAAAAPFQAPAQTKGVALHIQTPDKPLYLVCDGHRIEMALRNLLDNALKFTPAGGTIEMGVQSGAERAHGAQGESVRIWVQDTGVGIDAGDVPHIFERFYRSPQTRAEGSGLGLAIVRSVAQAHGGEVSVESTPGAGSRFELTLPSPPPAPDVRSA